MTYISRSEFEKRFGEAELSDLTDENDFTRAASDAAALIDGYLSTRYSLPLASVPTIVVAWAADITRFKLWDDHAPEEVRRRYEDVMGQLAALAKGNIDLPPGTDGTEAGISGANFGGYSAERVFTSDTLRDF